MFDGERLKLYAITDRKMIDRYNSNLSTSEAVRQVILGGATIIQIREKDLNTDDFYDVAVSVKEITNEYNVPLIINDNIEVAIRCDADGVHLGQDDLKYYGNDFVNIRKQFEGKILGISISTLEEAKVAEEYRVDYLGVGAIFNTKTKGDAKAVSLEELRNITRHIKIPCVAIGGINKDTLPLLENTGIFGCAIISAIFGARDIKQETRELSQMIEKYLRESIQ